MICLLMAKIQKKLTKEELIYDITIPYIIKLETKNYEILKQNMLNNFEEKIVTQQVKTKTKKIYKIVESYFYKNEKEMDYIKEVKKYCESQKIRIIRI